MLNTPLSELRRLAPKALTHASLVAFFERRGYPRKIGLFGAFERGQIKNPPERFVRIWAEAVGSDVETVMNALRQTHRQREKQTGPFARRKSFPLRAA